MPTVSLNPDTSSRNRKASDKFLLRRLVEHFAASALSLQATRALDAVRALVPACAAAIADALARRVAVDEPSYLSLPLAGFAGRAGGLGYALSAGPLGLQSETIECHRPELAVARTAVLDSITLSAT